MLSKCCWCKVEQLCCVFTTHMILFKVSSLYYLIKECSLGFKSIDYPYLNLLLHWTPPLICLILKAPKRTQAFWKRYVSFWLSWQLMIWRQQKAVSFWVRRPPTSAQGRWISTTSASAPSSYACWSLRPWFLSKETHSFGRYHYIQDNKVTIVVFCHYIFFIHSQLMEEDILVSAFFELTTLVVCEPSSVGFNMADVEVMKNLPDVCIPALKALLASPYRPHIESSVRTKISYKRYVRPVKPDNQKQPENSKMFLPYHFVYDLLVHHILNWAFMATFCS